MSYFSRLSKAFEGAPILPLTGTSRYAIISDCHRGDGSSGDNFLKNQNLYFTALSYYFNHGFPILSLGMGMNFGKTGGWNRSLRSTATYSG